MEDDDLRITVRFSDAIAERAKETADATLDQPASCAHRGAVFICDLHRDDGPMCTECMRAHLRAHSKTDDATCSSCGRLGETRRGAVAAGEFAVLTFTCADCRAT